MILRYSRFIYRKIRKESFCFGNPSGFLTYFNNASIFLNFLGGFFYWKKVTSSAFFLDFCMQFIDVIAHAKQKNLQFYPGFPTEQKSLKFVIIFQNPKSSFHLNATVHAVFDPCFTQDIFIGFLSFLQKTF